LRLELLVSFLDMPNKAQRWLLAFANQLAAVLTANSDPVSDIPGRAALKLSRCAAVASPDWQQTGIQFGTQQIHQPSR
jgi:hypothetical protein